MTTFQIQGPHTQELSLLDYSMLKYSASVIAAAAILMVQVMPYMKDSVSSYKKQHHAECVQVYIGLLYSRRCFTWRRVLSFAEKDFCS